MSDFVSFSFTEIEGTDFYGTYSTDSFLFRTFFTHIKETFDNPFSLKPWPNGPASSRKLNLPRDLRWLAKRTRKFPSKYTQFAKKIPKI